MKKKDIREELRRTVMAQIDDKVAYLQSRIDDLEESVWELKNPPKFKVGDEIIFKAGPTGGVFVDGVVIHTASLSPYYWMYKLWLPSLKLLHDFEDDTSFYDPEHVQLLPRADKNLL